MSTVVIDSVNARHIEGIVDVLLRVREFDRAYPPPVDAGFTRESMTDWLLNDEPIANWVAEDEGGVVGYIQVAKPHGYLSKFQEIERGSSSASLQFGEIGKFFVDPARQRSGIGKLLFDRAKAFTRENSLTALLAVVSTSVKAISFYDRNEMKLLGTFEGVHGTNLVYGDCRMKDSRE
jgi:GNAT superfamily N-acetyltransferase